MSTEDDGADRSFEPTQRKLDEQRRKGEVPRSTDLNTASAFLGLLLASIAFGPAAIIQLGTTSMTLLAQADTLAASAISAGQPFTGGLLREIGAATLPLLGLPLLFVLVSLLAQRALIFAPEKLQPKLSRIDPISNAKNKFGRNGLFEFAKSTVKLVVLSVILWAFLAHHLRDILHMIHLSPGLASREFMRLVVQFLALVFVVKLAIGAVDFFWQQAEHLRKNRMSHKEMRDEHKQAEGDPHAKAARQRRAREIATNSMLEDVATANVVIVNPTHYAVALKWSLGDKGAPICVAKGVDEIAARIRERAVTAKVPLHSDPPTARALHATVEIGAEVAPEHFGPVAVAIRYAESVRAKARKGHWA